jgi:hypothetical protein
MATREHCELTARYSDMNLLFRLGMSPITARLTIRVVVQILGSKCNSSQIFANFLTKLGVKHFANLQSKGPRWGAHFHFSVTCYFQTQPDGLLSVWKMPSLLGSSVNFGKMQQTYQYKDNGRVAGK